MKKFVVAENREEKARKIEYVLSDFLNQEIKKKKILDIGTGTGEIADYFSKNNEVYSVDVLDQRKNKKSKIIFKQVKSEKLPFKNNFFDVVISNHVIEHLENQKLHLQEIKRVLKQNGVSYLATPNKLFPWETHNKVLLIHYLPKKWFNLILKKTNKYQEDIYLITYFKLKKLLAEQFNYEEYTHKIIKYPNKYGFKIPILNKFPEFIIQKLNFISQTNVFVLRR